MKKIATLFMSLVLCLSCAFAVSAAQIPTPAEPILDGSYELEGVNDGTFSWGTSGISPRVGVDGSFSFSFKIRLPSDLFTVTSNSVRITVTPTSKTGERFELHVYECYKDLSGNVKEVKQMGNGYYMYDDGAIRYCDFSGFDTSKTYYMVMWKADNSKSVVGIGQIGSFGKVVDHI